MKLRYFMLPVVALVGGAGMAGTASAAPGSGATVIESSSCREFREGIICSESRWVVNRTETPSGNYISTAIGDTSFVYTGSDGCIWTSSQKKREQWVSTDNMWTAHVIQNTDRSNSCFGENIQCTNELHFHHVNGEAQIYKNENVCTPLTEP